MSASPDHSVWFTEDAAEFLDRAGTHLAERPITATVVATVAQRAAAAADHGEARPDVPFHWFATVTDRTGRVVGAAMRTAPFAPYPLFVLEMPEAAALALADALVGKGEEVGGANGALPATQVLAERVAAGSGRTVAVDMHSRLFRLGGLVEPPLPAGRLRRARADEDELACRWFRAFHRDADEQAGREPVHAARTADFPIEETRRRIEDGRIWFWVDDSDRPVHMTGGTRPAYGVSRVGPVYTPKEHRGRGYASAAVAGVSRTLREEGADEVTLFTDQANPTSNKIYVALGYEPFVDMVELLIG